MDVNEALARYQLAKLEFDRAELDLLQAIRGGQQAGWAYGTVTGRLPAPDGSVGSPALQQLKPEEGSVAARAADFLGPLRDVNAIRGAYARLSCRPILAPVSTLRLSVSWRRPRSSFLRLTSGRYPALS
jgi:hypothetical protein